MIIEINKDNLEEILADSESILVDIREIEEFMDFNIGGINIPSHLILMELAQISKYKNIVVACSNGFRSHIIAKVLAKKLNTSTIYHLTEGIF